MHSKIFGIYKLYCTKATAKPPYNGAPHFLSNTLSETRLLLPSPQPYLFLHLSLFFSKKALDITVIPREMSFSEKSVVQFFQCYLFLDPGFLHHLCMIFPCFCSSLKHTRLTCTPRAFDTRL